MLLKYTFNASFINKSSVSSSYWHAVQHCLRNKSFPSINLITMSSGPSLHCWKSNLSSFFLCPKYFFFHLLMFSLCKNAILIQQKCYFTRNISLYPNQEGPHWNVFIFLTVKTNRKKKKRRWEGGGSFALSAQWLCRSGFLTMKKELPRCVLITDSILSP